MIRFCLHEGFFLLTSFFCWWSGVARPNNDEILPRDSVPFILKNCGLFRWTAIETMTSDLGWGLWTDLAGLQWNAPCVINLDARLLVGETALVQPGPSAATSPPKISCPEKVAPRC